MNSAGRKRIPTYISVCFVITRLMISAWVGAAMLFVITSIAEQVHPSFDAFTRDRLATIRFPLYYTFGITLLVMTLVSGLFVSRSGYAGIRRSLVFIVLVTLSMNLMTLDYLFVYQPLQDVLNTESALPERSEEFRRLHRLSEIANTIHLGLALAAAILINLPRPHTRPRNPAGHPIGD